MATNVTRNISNTTEQSPGEPWRVAEGVDKTRLPFIRSRIAKPFHTSVKTHAADLGKSVEDWLAELAWKALPLDLQRRAIEKLKRAA